MKDGDILFDLAKTLGTSVEELTASANLCGVDATKMQIGQLLCLPGYDIARCDHVLETGVCMAGAPAEPDLGAEGKPKGRQCRVRAGGQGRQLPASDPCTATLTTSISLWFCCVCADPDRPYCQVYTVQLGDTTTSVAAKFGISEAELIAQNSGKNHWRAWLPVSKQQRARNSSRCSASILPAEGGQCSSDLPAVVPPPRPLPASQQPPIPPLHAVLPCSPADYLDAGFTLPRAGQYVRLPGW